MNEPRYPEVEVQLSGQDGNAGSIMGRVARALKQGGAENTEIDQFRAECMSGDYDHLLRTCMEWVNVA